jgi:hypothetical protein
MNATIFVVLTIAKVIVIGYAGYKFFKHFRSDGKKALRYLGWFLIGVFGLTAVEFIVAFYVPSGE